MCIYREMTLSPSRSASCHSTSKSSLTQLVTDEGRVCPGRWLQYDPSSLSPRCSWRHAGCWLSNQLNPVWSQMFIVFISFKLEGVMTHYCPERHPYSDNLLTNLIWGAACYKKESDLIFLDRLIWGTFELKRQKFAIRWICLVTKSEVAPSGCLFLLLSLIGSSVLCQVGSLLS